MRTPFLQHKLIFPALFTRICTPVCLPAMEVPCVRFDPCPQLMRLNLLSPPLPWYFIFNMQRFHFKFQNYFHYSFIKSEMSWALDKLLAPSDLFISNITVMFCYLSLKLHKLIRAAVLSLSALGQFLLLSCQYYIPAAVLSSTCKI